MTTINLRAASIDSLAPNPFDHISVSQKPGEHPLDLLMSRLENNSESSIHKPKDVPYNPNTVQNLIQSLNYRRQSTDGQKTL
jgi:hypothetical protein